MDSIRVRGARTHNLKNLSVELPSNRLVVITGLSGSGKSSFAFDTLYAEGQRRYVESLSAYARQFLELMAKPEVDLIEGLSPAIAIEQKSGEPQPALDRRHGDRDPRLPAPALRARRHALLPRARPRARSADRGADGRPAGAARGGHALMVLAPVIAGRKGEQADLLEELRAQGFTRVRIDGTVHDLDSAPQLRKNVKHSVDVVIDRLRMRADARQRLAESFGDRAAPCRRQGRWCVETDERKEHLFSVASSRARSATTRCPSSSRACSRSTTRWAPARAATAWAPSSSSTRSASSPIPNLSLASGAIRGWDRRNHFYYSMLQSLAKHYDFDIESPWEMLTDARRRT